MVLETERLILREYTWDDFDVLYTLLSDPVTMQHYPQPYNEAGTRRWIQWNLDNYQKYGFGLWAIILKQTGCFIGDCGITMQPIDGESLPEIGYHIHTGPHLIRQPDWEKYIDFADKKLIGKIKLLI